jgi:hypothetical protein
MNSGQQEAQMRHVFIAFNAIAIIVASSGASLSQEKSILVPMPRTVTMADLKNIHGMDGQLVQLMAIVRHTDTAQVFTFGEKQGTEIHVVVPNPATDAANVGDTVGLTGFVRRFSANDFERDYRWFRRGDYPDVKNGDWVIVATSVRTPEGTELVPSGTISSTPPNAPKTTAPTQR